MDGLRPVPGEGAFLDHTAKARGTFRGKCHKKKESNKYAHALDQVLGVVFDCARDYKIHFRDLLVGCWCAINTRSVIVNWKTYHGSHSSLQMEGRRKGTHMPIHLMPNDRPFLSDLYLQPFLAANNPVSHRVFSD
jgi:hypothetical protein